MHKKAINNSNLLLSNDLSVRELRTRHTTDSIKTLSGIYLPGRTTWHVVQSIIFLFMEEKPSECPMKGWYLSLHDLAGCATWQVNSRLWLHANYNLKYFTEFLETSLKEFKVSLDREKDCSKQPTHLRLETNKHLKKVFPNACSSNNITKMHLSYIVSWILRIVVEIK